MKPLYSYIVLEMMVLCTIAAMLVGRGKWELLTSRGFVESALVLFFLWTGADLAAVKLEIWSFPQGGTLPFRFLGLPLEEYFLFLVHSFMCLALLVAMKPVGEAS